MSGSNNISLNYLTAKAISIARNATLFAEAFNQWKTERKGPMAVDGTNNFLWLRLPLKGNPDPSAGPNTPHLELFVDVSQQMHELKSHLIWYLDVERRI